MNTDSSKKRARDETEVASEEISEPKPEVCEWATTEGWGEEDSKHWNSCEDQAYDCECGLRGCLYEGVENTWIARRKAWGCTSECGGRNVEVECEVCKKQSSESFLKLMKGVHELLKSRYCRWGN